MFYDELPVEGNYPNENYFAHGPNPAPGLQTDASKNPARLHAPGGGNKRWFVKDDASDTAIQRIPGATIPVPVKEVPGPPVYVYGSIPYLPPPYQFQPGWRQAFVPEAGMRASLAARSPLLQLSQPIKSISGNKAASVDSIKHANHKFRAPKAR